MIPLLAIDPSANNPKDNYKLLIGTIIPRPIAFVTSLSANNILNGAPYSFFSIVSSNPPMISLGIQRSDGIPKDTARNIIDNREFVIHVVSQHNVEQVNITATALPPDQSEIELAQLTPVDSTIISVPGVKEAKVRMECVLEQALALGEVNSIPTCDLIIGRIVQFHIDETIYHEGRIDPTGLAAVGRLAGIDYTKIGQIFPLARP